MVTQLPSPKRGGAPEFLVHVYCGQTAGWIKMPLGTEIDLGPGNFVLDGDPAPLRQKAGGAPQFLGYYYCSQTAGWIKMALGMEVGFGPVHIVLDGDTAPQKGGRAPQFSAHLYCGQTSGCIKMPLGIELGLGPGDFVLDGDPASPLPKGHRSPIFGPYLLWPNGCMDQDATWYGARPRPRRLCVRW